MFCAAETADARRVDLERTEVFGVRAGYWLDPIPWLGFAGDLSYFKTEGTNSRFTVVPLSLLLMLRLPLLATEEIPRGRLQPYVALGPSVFLAESFVDFRPQLSGRATDSSIDIGFDARSGVAWQFHRRLAVFGEYRFTHLSISGKDAESFLGGDRTGVDTTLNVHHVLVGVSIRF